MYEMYEYQDLNPFLFYSEESLDDFNSVPRFCSLLHALPKVAELLLAAPTASCPLRPLRMHSN